MKEKTIAKAFIGIMAFTGSASTPVEINPPQIIEKTPSQIPSRVALDNLLASNTTPTSIIIETPKPAPTTTPEAIKIAPAEVVKEYSPSKLIKHGNLKNKELCLTFDDGYNSTYCKKLIDILKEKNIQCTFFIAGSALTNNPNLWREAVKNGNLVCNHTQGHMFLAGKSEKEITNQVKAWEKSATKVFGKDYVAKMKKEFPYFRPPGGSYDKKVLEVLGKLGYTKTFWWTHEEFYGVYRLLGKSATSETKAKACLKYYSNNPPNGAIVLAHPSYNSTGYISQIIENIQNRGFTIKNLPDILN